MSRLNVLTAFSGKTAASSVETAPAGLLRLVPKMPELPERLRGGRIEKLVNYFKNVGRDYLEAGQEIRDGSRRRPVRAALLSASLTGVYYAWRTNPTERDFEAAFVERCQLLGTVPDSIRNPAAERWHDDIWRSMNAGALRRWDLVLASVLWRDDYDAGCAVFPARCSYLRPGYLDFSERVVDVGFLGRWWVMENRMEDYDVNSDEWDEQGRPTNPVQL